MPKSDSKEYRGIGLMSGTSLDGIDLLYASFKEEKGKWDYTILDATTISYSAEWQKRLATIQEATAEAYAETDVEYGHLLGEALADFISDRQIKPQFIASHGHTIFHRPERHFTAQIGCGETIVSHLTCPVVANFRAKDVALGGQGAPLVPFGEQYLFPDTELFLNLGGFSNITIGNIAFDVSPCNFILNHLIRLHDPVAECDIDGRLARNGEIIPSLLEELNALSYYDAPPPKSLGREWFEEELLPIVDRYADRPVADRLHTACRHIALQIGRSIDRFEIEGKKILITGGGFKNNFLAEEITFELKKRQIEVSTDRTDRLIDYKEALIFAFLGLQTLLGRPNVLASVTGAPFNSVTGSIHLPPKPSLTNRLSFL